ncbi:MAG: type III polyketide synthase [Ktedonobacterales bacterium]
MSAIPIVRAAKSLTVPAPQPTLTPDRAVRYPRIQALSPAYARYDYSQEEVATIMIEYMYGPNWEHDPTVADKVKHIQRLFAASKVERRQSMIDTAAFYSRPRSTGERMAEFVPQACALGRAALEGALTTAQEDGLYADALTDLIVVTCTGYAAPGVDILLARDLNLPPDMRRLMIGHMGCFGGIVGLRQSLAAVQLQRLTRPQTPAAVALLCVEITSLHWMPIEDPEVLTGYALFADAAAALLLTDDPAASGPELVDAYCVADFNTSDQMSWNITDNGFQMSLSPRVPVTLRRHIETTVDHLLTPHGLRMGDVAHWLVHPGGPSILDAIQGKLGLSDEQMALSWRVLREHGNCSSVTILLILDELLRSGQAHPGEWGVLMAFGPGLTLETALIRF